MNKKKLWWFNPENDIALARNIASFTPPKAGVEMRRAGALLPMWLGGSGDMVDCDGVDEAILSRWQRDFRIEVEPWSHCSAGLSPTPWGWSQAARKHFADRGFNLDALPRDDVLDRMRTLSHRRTAAQVARIVNEQADFPLWPAAEGAAYVEELRRLISRSGRWVVKSPWSSSGRGLLYADSGNIERIVSSAAGTIRQQGSVMVERAARRVLDFAMLFNVISDGDVEFVGYSIFDADERGAYQGNIVDSDDALKALITQYIPARQLDDVRTMLSSAIRQVVGNDYSGPIGVDMLIADADGKNILDAVVEINFRYTMGFVAHSLARHVAKRGRFSCLHRPSTACADYNLDESGCITKGCLGLTQPGCNFDFVLEVP